MSADILSDPIELYRGLVGEDQDLLTTFSDQDIYLVRDSAFRGFTALEQVCVPCATAIGHDAFNGCTSLESFKTANCASIGDMAFYGCTSLVDVAASSVRELGDHAFARCTSLKRIDIPNAEKIGAGAFRWCTSLRYVKLLGDEFCSLGDSTVFGSCSSLEAVYVPSDLLETYQTASHWTTYADYLIGV